ncbi:type-F conjugative transfer system pilin chaperone TraQ [Escherichia coli]|uniref:type-F conjugative transfer system pilin chaperone TraQ n=1 Tax=Escherichia coli TaxID=562 RepID=UPI004067FC36
MQILFTAYVCRNVGICSQGVWFHIVAPNNILGKHFGWLFFSGGVDCGAPLCCSAYEVLGYAWIARVSTEEREALEAGQRAMMEGQQEGRTYALTNCCRSFC